VIATAGGSLATLKRPVSGMREPRIVAPRPGIRSEAARRGTFDEEPMMNLRPTLLSAAMLLSVGAGGAHAADAAPIPLRQIVPYLEARYEGEVVAIALDDAGDKPAHYHVDLRYPASGIARLDVDAGTLELAPRVPPHPAEKWTTSLAGASAYAATQLGGQVLAAELDAADGDAAHYDVDVRMADGRVARLKVDPRTRQLAWRSPPVHVE
jgi:uncharacterized membrane protein YkoI